MKHQPTWKSIFLFIVGAMSLAVVAGLVVTVGIRHTETLSRTSTPYIEQNQSGSESLRAGRVLQVASRAVALKFGVSKLSRPQVAARVRAAHASAVVWVASGGEQRCFYLEVVMTGSGPQGTSACGTDSATACSIDRLSGFILGIVPRGWTGELTIATGAAPIETVAVNKGYFLNSETSLLPHVPLILSSTSGGKKSRSCMATLS